VTDEPSGPALPEAIGRFRIESLLGRGAMGVVYKAHDPHIERPVAIKLVRADLLEGEDREEYLRRFRGA
jgi:serine/threonine-protein kinase